MVRPYDLGSGAVTLRQHRWKLGLVMLAGLGSLALCLWGIAHPPEETELYFGALGGAPLSVGIVVFGAVGTVRPGRLTVGEGGIVHRTAFRTRRWAWSDLEAIELATVRRVPAIVFHSRTASDFSRDLHARTGLPGNDSLPGAWPIKTRELFALLIEAKARWG